MNFTILTHFNSDVFQLQLQLCSSLFFRAFVSMEEALWHVAPDAGVVASASLVGGSLAKVLDGLGGLAQMVRA